MESMESMFQEQLLRAAEEDDPQVLLWNLFERATAAVCGVEEPECLNPHLLAEWLLDHHPDPGAVDRYREELQPKLERFVADLVERYTPIQ